MLAGRLIPTVSASSATPTTPVVTRRATSPARAHPCVSLPAVDMVSRARPAPMAAPSIIGSRVRSACSPRPRTNARMPNVPPPPSRMPSTSGPAVRGADRASKTAAKMTGVSKHRPATASPPAAQSTHGQADRDRRQCLDGGDRSAGRPPTGQYTPPASHGHRGCQRPQSVTMQSLGWCVGTANLRGGGNHEDTSPRRPRVRRDKPIIIGPPLLSLSDLTPRRPGTNVPHSLRRIHAGDPRGGEYDGVGRGSRRWRSNLPCLSSPGEGRSPLRQA